MSTCTRVAPQRCLAARCSRGLRRARVSLPAAPACKADACDGAADGVALCVAPQRRALLLAGAALLLPVQRARALEVSANPEPLGNGLMRYYGRATSSSSYGGYGGTDSNYRYYFDLPDTWKTDTVSKVDKATNGTDVRYSDPTSRESKAYVTSFNGYPTLKEDRLSIISDLALSDSSLQDALSYADAVEVSERTLDDQLYVDFNVVSGGRTIYATVTSDGARLFALFVNGATPATDEKFRAMRDSLHTIK